MYKNLINFNFCFKKLGADGFPEIRPNHIVVEMSDGSIFEGNITVFPHHNIPLWMRAQNLPPQKYGAFIRTATNENFISTLKPDNVRVLLKHSRFLLQPRYAELGLGKIHIFSAQSFELYDVDHHKHTSLTNLPPSGCIYISLPHGPVYSANFVRFPTEGEFYAPLHPEPSALPLGKSHWWPGIFQAHRIRLSGYRAGYPIR